MNPSREKKSFRNLQYSPWTRLIRSICWSTLREAGEAEGVPANVLGALPNEGYRDNPLPAIVLSKILYGLLFMQLVFLDKRRHASVRHYIHRLSGKRPISFYKFPQKMLTIHYVDFIPVVRNNLRALETNPNMDDERFWESCVNISFWVWFKKKKKIEFTSFRFLKFLFCFQFLYVCAVCNILIRIC